MPIAFNDIHQGSWSCRWGGWIILVCERPSGWSVIVWQLPSVSMARKQIASARGMDSAQDAVTYACDVLRVAGVTLFVSGVPQHLEEFLSFSPAPQEVV